MPLKLNLGCGHRKIEGFVSVDKDEKCHPDLVVDLERFPWPWNDNEVEQVLLYHVLEHLGQNVEVFLNIMSELWRVCVDGATITIIVPHFRNWTFYADPTHVRAISVETIRLFDQNYNRYCIENNLSDSLLGISLGVDFTVEESSHELNGPWKSKWLQNTMSLDELNFAINTYNNVVESTKMVCRVRKSNITK